jgi:hypothetical protein
MWTIATITSYSKWCTTTHFTDLVKLGKMLKQDSQVASVVRFRSVLVPAANSLPRGDQVGQHMLAVSASWSAFWE